MAIQVSISDLCNSVAVVFLCSHFVAVSVCLSVCLSVTLANYRMQEKLNVRSDFFQFHFSDTKHHSIASVIFYLTSNAGFCQPTAVITS